MASSPRAGNLLKYAAYDSDFHTVKAILSHGTSIRARTIPNGEPRSMAPQFPAANVPLSLLWRVVDVNALDRD